MSKWKKNVVSIDFKSGVDKEFNPQKDGWGFSITDTDGRSAFVEIGTRNELEKEIFDHDNSLLCLVLDAVQNGTGGSLNELAIEILDDAIAIDEGIIIQEKLIINLNLEVEKARGISGSNY